MKHKRRFLFLLFFVFSLCLSLFVFRKPFFTFALEKMVPSFAYENRRWEGGELIYEKVAWGDGLQIEEVHLSFTWEAPFYVEAHLYLVSPLVTLEQGEETPFVPFSFGDRPKITATLLERKFHSPLDDLSLQRETELSTAEKSSRSERLSSSITGVFISGRFLKVFGRGNIHCQWNG